MRNTFLGVLLVLLFVQGAEAKYNDTLSLTCAQAKSLLENSGSILFRTGELIFNRYYASNGWQFAYVQTKDKKHCPLGYLKDSTRMSEVYVYIEAAYRGCSLEGETILLNYREVEDDSSTRPIYSVCRNGQRVREDHSGRFVGKGSGTSVIGTSFRSGN